MILPKTEQPHRHAERGEAEARHDHRPPGEVRASLVFIQVVCDGRLLPAVEGRVIGADESGVELDVAGTSHRYDYADLVRGRVQVEFRDAGDDDADDQSHDQSDDHLGDRRDDG